nr:MAG TPA: hypothetical protein [Caudoviricetes sp.]
MPDGVGFSFMEKIMLEQLKNIETEDTEEYKQFVDKFKPKKRLMTATPQRKCITPC